MDIKLELADPTIFAKCPKCTRSFLGNVVGNYYAKAFPRRRPDRTAQDVVAAQTCENCGTPLELLYEVK